MSVFSWTRSKEQKPAGQEIAAKPMPRPVQRAPSSSDQATDPIHSAVPAQNSDNQVIQSFSGVPKFDGLLTAGPDTVYPVDTKDRHKYVALNTPGRKAIVLLAEGIKRDHSEVTSLIGALNQARYTITVLFATSEVIGSVYTNHLTLPNSTGDQEGNPARKSVNIFMETIGEWIRYAVKEGATDIHLERWGSKGYARVRVDGVMEPIKNECNGTYPGTFIEKCMADLYVNQQQRKSGSASMFDGSASLYCMVPYTEIPGHSLKLRYQSLPGNEGPKVVLRLLNVDESVKTLSYEELGYEPSQIKTWKSASRTPSGAVIIAGVTGSGKSTTQKSFMELNPNASEMAIYTLEDPVEYPIPVAHQIPIQRDLSNPEESAKAFANNVSGLMRSDPDMVMLGEVRDKFSANGLQQLAETGHMALCTVHAHLISGIIPRLTNNEIGLSREVLSGPNMLTLLVYQALVAKLCPHCAMTTEEAVGTSEDIDAMVDVIKRLKLDTSGFRWKRVDGCSYCNHRGTKGQTVVAEMLLPDEDWLKHIRDGRDDLAVEVFRSHSDLDLTSSNMDGKTIFEHALYKAMNGISDARQCNRFDNAERFVHRYLRLSRSHLKSVA